MTALVSPAAIASMQRWIRTYALPDTARVERATETLTPRGGTQTVWTTVATLAARLERDNVQAHEQEAAGQLRTWLHTRLYCDAGAEVQTTDRVTVGGYVWQVRGVDPPDLLTGNVAVYLVRQGT